MYALVRRNHLIKKIAKWLVLIVGVLGFFLIITFQSLFLVISLFSLFSLLIVVAFNDGAFTDPIAIFTIFYYPYSTWFAYYSLLNGGADMSGLEVSLELSYLGLLSFAFVGCLASLFFRDKNDLNIMQFSRDGSLGLSAKIIMIVSTAVLLLAIAEVVLSGSSSKREALDADLYLSNISDFSAVILSAGALLLLVRYISIGWSAAFLNGYYLVAFIALMAGFLFLGERDYIFRIGFCSLVIYFSRSKSASVSVLLIILFIMVVFLPVTQAAKGLLLPGAIFSLDYSWGDIFYGEFISASRNVYMLVMHGVDHSYSYLVSDFVRAFVPFSGSYGFQSSGAWYNEVYRVENSFSGVAGWGFSLVAEGYLISGEVGVIFVMALVSVVLNFFYYNRFRSAYWFVFYVICLSVSIYSIRSDLANYLSQIFKVGGGALLIYWFFGLILRRRNFKNTEANL